MTAPRKLAGILAADVAGYSRLTGLDEEGTLKRLRKLHRELINPAITLHRGRIVKTIGDGILVEFPSVVDAVRCALDVQRGMDGRNLGVPPEQRIEFRVGVNLGDVVVEGDDLLGDGVNVAARVEGIAAAAGICISDSAYQQVRDKLDIRFEDMGEQPLKNIARPVRVYRVQLDTATAEAAPSLALPDKPSIAVLPFNNMSGDPEQEYFADGMAEEILTALSRCSWLFVIARNSSFIYKGRSVDIRQVGRELGVRYVLEGSVRRGGDRLRFTGQLIDATSGAHIWADRFEGEMSDVFELQDRITESVVAAIEPKLQLAEIERLKGKPAANLDAYDLLLRAQQLEYEFTEVSLSAALRCLEQALAIDPDCAPAMALAAYCYTGRRIQGWSQNVTEEATKGLRLVSRALELGKDDAKVLWMAAYAVWQLAVDGQRAKELAYRSLPLNPNSAIALTIAAFTETTLGNTAKALEMFRRAERLSPRDPRAWLMATGLAFAHYLEGQFDEAALQAKRALVQNPRFAIALRFLAASLAKLGLRDRAAEVIHELLKIEPQLTLSKFRARVMFMDETVWIKYADGLRLAGLPE